jgi:hypothetical protein
MKATMTRYLTSSGPTKTMPSPTTRSCGDGQSRNLTGLWPSMLGFFQPDRSGDVEVLTAGRMPGCDGFADARIDYAELGVDAGTAFSR